MSYETDSMSDTTASSSRSTTPRPDPADLPTIIPSFRYFLPHDAIRPAPWEEGWVRRNGSPYPTGGEGAGVFFPAPSGMCNGPVLADVPDLQVVDEQMVDAQVDEMLIELIGDTDEVHAQAAPARVVDWFDSQSTTSTTGYDNSAVPPEFADLFDSQATTPTASISSNPLPPSPSFLVLIGFTPSTGGATQTSANHVPIEEDIPDLMS